MKEFIYVVYEVGHGKCNPVYSERKGLQLIQSVEILSKVKVVIMHLNTYKSPGSDDIQAAIIESIVHNY